MISKREYFLLVLFSVLFGVESTFQLVAFMENETIPLMKCCRTLLASNLLGALMCQGIELCHLPE